MATQSTAADLRARAARDLLARAAHEPVELVVLTGMELCVLGAPKQVLCEEKLAAAWLGQSQRRRSKAIRLTTQSLVKRGLLLAERPADSAQGPDSPHTADLPDSLDAFTDSPGDDSYALDPALGLVLAARSKPGFVVVTSLGSVEARTPRMYALGDEEQQVRAVVAELPEALPPGAFPHLAAMGPLGRLHRYVLLSRDSAADWLADWADQPGSGTLKAPDGRPPARLVSVYRHDEGRDFLGFTTAFRHDGGRAQLLVDGAEDGGVAGTYDRDGVRGIMSDLLVLGRP